MITQKFLILIFWRIVDIKQNFIATCILFLRPPDLW